MTASLTKNLDYATAHHYVNANHGLDSTLKLWSVKTDFLTQKGNKNVHSLLGLYSENIVIKLEEKV